jgi:membrane protease YdiL (CAAX protease family)
VPEFLDLAAPVCSWLAIALAGGVVAAVLRLFAPAARRPFPPQRRRAAVWTGPRVAVLFLALFLTPSVIYSLVNVAPLARWLLGADAAPQLARRLAMSVAVILSLPIQVAAWWGLVAAAGYPPAALGLNRARTAADYAAAYRTWLVLTPPVYAVTFVVVVVYGLTFGKQPAEHPILQTFQGGSLPTGLVALLMAEAVVAAPVSEELFFRGALQPALVDRPWGGDFALALAALVGIARHTPDDLNFRDPEAVLSCLAPGLFILALLPLYRALDRWGGLVRWLPVRDPEARRQAARAIFGTAALFANFHATVWPTPIPLFVLAVGLGWLAYRTQGVLAPIVVHVLFNAIPFGALFFKYTIHPS